MKKLLVLFLLATSTLFAQNNDAKKLLDEVSVKAKSYDNISIDFKYVLENTEENIKQETKGDVVMQGEKYRLNILGITRIFDGQSIFSISPEDEEITVSKGSDQDESTITPSKMLSFYQDGFTYNMDIIQDVSGRKIQFVKLIPIDSNSEIKNVLLGVDTKTKHIYRLIEVGKNGTKTTLTVNSFKTNETLSKSLFTFDESKYKDYYINKLD
ncbi:LolA family protein [Olleya sp. HaHaR_3_96]|uniref:LolA family protein n=1 Tax=Olleya sp. HaHaR_3_96 TaxID=2745560 RepID=UPI001C4FB6E5|nr:outer membrane lipoprotein carrier protein LolA [Olleya sp. HaHaR_3_96]QXP58441.1 outer membrane lipoprotein carrier protein LolA [Olleya sp. HaHaR_3_96]